MGRHRLEPAPRVRPRVGRMAAAGLSLAVTMVALLGAVGVLPIAASDGAGRTQTASHAADGAHSTGSGSTVDTPSTSRSDGERAVAGAVQDVAEPVADTSALPANSGTGRRVVFSRSAQRVWLVAADESVASTYLVSGSVKDNLAPGTYAVYSRSRWAVGVDDSGVMQYFVRFAHGPQAAIGFHSIPTKHGTPVQTVAQLGTPRSHGCIRQRLADAARMWAFAKTGTPVVVVA